MLELLILLLLGADRTLVYVGGAPQSFPPNQPTAIAWSAAAYDDLGAWTDGDHGLEFTCDRFRISFGVHLVDSSPRALRASAAPFDLEVSLFNQVPIRGDEWFYGVPGIQRKTSMPFRATASGGVVIASGTPLRYELIVEHSGPGPLVTGPSSGTWLTVECE